MNRLKRGCCEHPRQQRWPRPSRDASRGGWRAIRLRARSTGPRSALHLRQRTCRRLAAPTGRRAHFFIAEARSTERRGRRLCCLSSQSKTRVHEPHSHALGRPANTPCQVVPKPGAISSLRPRCSPMASHQRETRTERLRTVDRSRAPCRSLPLPKLVLSPRTGRDLEKRCSLCAKPLLAESPGHGMLQRQRTLAVAFGLERTCGDTCDPATEAVAAIAATTQHR